MSTKEIVARCEQLFEDLRFGAVKDWKAAAPGRKAIGYMPIYVPREIVHAAGMLPVGIFGGGDQMEVIQGDAYYQSYICRIPRSTLELGLTGRLDCLDGMLFPSICDVIRNLSGMWTMLFPDRYVRYVDVPQNYERAVGGVYWRRELEILREDLGRLAGHTVSDADLSRSIAVYNENRAAIRALYEARSRQPWFYPTSEVFLFLRAGNLLPPEEHTAMLRQYLKLAPLEADRCEQDQSRVVLVGMFCEQPPLGLLLTLERAGCWVVDDDLLLGLRWITCDTPTEGDPLQNLVEAYLNHSAVTASRYLPDGDHGRGLVDSVRQNRAEGVIFCAPSFCDPALLEQPMLVRALEREGIPHTQFKYSEDTGQFRSEERRVGKECRSRWSPYH